MILFRMGRAVGGILPPEITQTLVGRRGVLVNLGVGELQ